MSKYLDLNIKELHDLLVKKEITPLDLVNESFERIEKNGLNDYITLDKDNAIEVSKNLGEPEVDNLLWGIPVAIKDNICTKDLLTTCGSHMLDNFKPIYDATVVKKIKDNKMIIVGKTNMDEFAMGSTSRTSYFGAPLNAWDKTKVSGGSSGGSASTVAAREVVLSLGSDTGGSIRQPASYQGIVGMKPTYGRCSRYGLVAFGSSLDQIGPLSKNVYENALMLNVIAGQDDNDMTSSYKEVEDYTRLIGKDIKGMNIGIPNYFVSDIVSSEIKESFNKVIDILKELGANVDYIDIKYLDKSVLLYQIIAMGEASSNLAKFDGLRYGHHYDSKDLYEEYTRTRSEGFGAEVKRRIMVGSYLLSGENAKIYYDKALSIRDDMRASFKEAFKKYDFIIGPTTTTVAYGQDESLDDPLKSFMDDVLVIPVNMAGLPGLSLPIGFNKDKMPIGMHIIADEFKEASIYQIASVLEDKLNLDLNPKGGK